MFPWHPGKVQGEMFVEKGEHGISQVQYRRE